MIHRRIVIAGVIRAKMRLAHRSRIFGFDEPGTRDKTTVATMSFVRDGIVYSASITTSSASIDNDLPTFRAMLESFHVKRAAKDK